MAYINLVQAGLSGVFAYWGYTTTKDAKTQAALYSQAERRRWREAPLWGETLDEQVQDYRHTRNVPGRVEIPFFSLDQPHYEPTNLVVSGRQYQPLDRWVNRLNPFQMN